MNTWAPPPCVWLTQLVLHTGQLWSHTAGIQKLTSPVSEHRDVWRKGTSDERRGHRHSAESLPCDCAFMQWIHHQRQEKMLRLPLWANKGVRACVCVPSCLRCHHSQRSRTIHTQTPTQPRLSRPMHVSTLAHTNWCQSVSFPKHRA